MISNNDTIVAPATAHGIGSVSIVRMSGAKSYEIAKKLIQNATLTPRHAHFKKLFIGKNFIDEAIVLYFKAPHSYTGEDIVEFQTHGGFVISNMIINELIRMGARLAMGGEFSKRAFLNGKMDLAKANAISSLIMSRSEDSAKILSRTLSGELSDFVNELRSELVRTLAYCETSIDYAEEDLPSDILAQINEMLLTNTQKLDEITQISRSRKGLIDGFKVAIIGKPNVGKSSLLNALLHENRAIISDVAGTTRDTIEENLQISTHLVRIIDTAGIQDSEDKIEKIGIENSYNASRKADIIVAVFDSAKPSDENDKKILKICQNSGKDVIYVLNKSDLEMKFDLGLKNPIKISAKNDISLIIEALEEYFNSKNYDGLMLSSTHEILACENAKNALIRAKNLLDENTLELFAYEINTAISEISSITRPFERDEILDEMFSHFCLGK